jgi:hypothetical protein
LIPAEFAGYFTATAAAAGVLIGLLFVAVSLRPETVFGERAMPAAKAQAGSAFTSLVNSFFVSLVALIPRASLGEIATIMALISLYGTVRLHRQVARQELHLVLLILSLIAYLYQLVVGVNLILLPHDSGEVVAMCFLVIASFAFALSRAWSLVQGRHLAQRPAAGRQ